MKTLSLISMVAPLLYTATVTGFAQDLATPLQEGLFEEEANRDFPAAIQAYQTAVALFDQQRKLAATAVFRLGECFRKLGETNQAITYYQRILAEFSDQAPLVQTSRDHLDSLSVLPAEPALAEPVPPAVAEEENELRRLQVMLRESPDLLNAWIEPRGTTGTPLHQASRRGQLQVAQFLLENKAEINARNNAQQTPLSLAVATGNKSMVELLLEHGAEVNAQDNQQLTPLHQAAQRGFNAIAEVLLAQGADSNASGAGGQTPLHLAAVTGHRILVETLLDHEANIDAVSTGGATPLLQAVSKAQLAVAELLLDRGASIQTKDNGANSVLHLASSANANRDDLIRLLLSRGADVNPQNDEGNTPVHTAARNGDEAFLRLILPAKPDLEMRNQRGLTPLQEAVLNRQNRLSAVKLLLEAGASPNVDFPDGATPLHYAASNQYQELLELLLTHGADPNVPDRRGETPLSNAKQWVASTNPRQSAIGLNMAQLLIKHGADEDLHRRSLIMIRRGGWTQPVFYRGTNSYNQFTLFELLVAVFTDPAMQRQLAFPELGLISLHSLPSAPIQVLENPVIALNLETGDCTLNEPLAWGDVVEIPEADHKINETWSGLSAQACATFEKCLRRQVRLLVGGESAEFILLPRLPFLIRSGRAIKITPATLPMGTRPPQNPDLPTPQLWGFRLKEVLLGSSLLRTSSDLSQIKVTRIDPDTAQPMEMRFDLSNDSSYSAITDLWLRQGDVIEVP